MFVFKVFFGKYKMSPLTVNTKEAASLIGVCRTLFYEMKSDGRLGVKPIAFGRKKVWSVEELTEWVRAGCPTRDKWQKRKQ